MILDIGLSLIFALSITSFYEATLNWQVIAVSIAFSLLPDIDVPIELFMHRKLGGKESGFHRELTHYPIIYIPIVAFVIIFLGFFWGSLLLINLVSHFLHDSLWTGWGLKWFWPFSKKSIKFFSNYDGTFNAKKIATWSPVELKEIMREHGDESWFKNMYLRLSPVLIAEIAVLVLAVVILLYFIS